MSEKKKTTTFRKATAQLVYNAWTEHLDKRLQSDTWDSSAQKLENALIKRGVKPPIKLYYEYKFPDDMKNFEFDQATLFTRVFPAVYENYLEQFKSVKTKTALLQVQKIEAKTDLSAFFGFCICLALSDMKNLKSVFEQTYTKCMQEVYQMAEKIREMNPELQNITDWRNLDFVNGAIYGFAPKDIDFFIQSKRESNETSDKNKELKRRIDNLYKISEFTGAWPGYFPAPETSDEILKAIENYKQAQIQQQSMLDSFSVR